MQLSVTLEAELGKKKKKWLLLLGVRLGWKTLQNFGEKFRQFLEKKIHKSGRAGFIDLRKLPPASGPKWMPLRGSEMAPVSGNEKRPLTRTVRAIDKPNGQPRGESPIGRHLKFRVGQRAPVSFGRRESETVSGPLSSGRKSGPQTTDCMHCTLYALHTARRSDTASAVRVRHQFRARFWRPPVAAHDWLQTECELLATCNSPLAARNSPLKARRQPALGPVQSVASGRARWRRPAPVGGRSVEAARRKVEQRRAEAPPVSRWPPIGAAKEPKWSRERPSAEQTESGRGSGPS